MYQISPTLDCQNIIKHRKENNLPIYNFGLGVRTVFRILIQLYVSIKMKENESKSKQN